MFEVYYCWRNEERHDGWSGIIFGLFTLQDQRKRLLLENNGDWAFIFGKEVWPTLPVTYNKISYEKKTGVDTPQSDIVRDHVTVE